MLDVPRPARDRRDRARTEGFPAVRLRSPDAGLEATFVPDVGMVGASLRHGRAELLWRGEGLRRYAGGRTTMGLPLLHPWANRVSRDRFRLAGRRVDVAANGSPPRDEHGLAIHGLLGGSPLWRRVDGPGLSAELDFGMHPGLLAAFPFPHRLRLDVVLHGPTLTMTTTLTPTGEAAVPVAFGFHPYLQLPDAPRERWRVRLPPMRRVEVDDRGLPTGRLGARRAHEGPLGARTFDDGFTDLDVGATFAVTGANRVVTVRLERGYPMAQVFAPSSADVVCFEPMTAPTDALVTGDGLQFVAPGDAYEATFSITVQHREEASWTR
jgi:aldose 1-epimerase